VIAVRRELPHTGHSLSDPRRPSRVVSRAGTRRGVRPRRRGRTTSWRHCSAKAAESGDIWLIAEMLSLPGGNRFPALDLTPQQEGTDIVGVAAPVARFVASPCRLSSPWQRTPPEAVGVLAHGLGVQRKRETPSRRDFSGQSRSIYRSLEVLRWGLISHWAKDIKIGFSTFNTRGRTSRPSRPSARRPAAALSAAAR